MAVKRGIERGFDLDDFKQGAEVAFRACEYLSTFQWRICFNLVIIR